MSTQDWDKRIAAAWATFDDYAETASNSSSAARGSDFRAGGRSTPVLGPFVAGS